MKVFSTIKKLNLSYLQLLGFIGIYGVFFEPGLKFFLLFFLFGKSDITGYKHNEAKAYDRSIFLSNLNPATIFYSLFQAFGHIFINRRYKDNLPNTETYQQKTDFILPFKEKWYVANGGIKPETSHSWDILTQRYAYDFVIIDESGKSFKNSGKKLNDYYCFGTEILAPADGIVVRVNNFIKDYEGLGNNSIDWKCLDFRGNFILIKHSKNEYSFLAHLNKDSIVVKKGDFVKKGQKIALCGNSGHSTEPHLHFHIQDRKSFWTAAGLPLKFIDVNNIGKASYISRNDQVSNTNGFQNQVSIS